ncbi:MAG TPA: molybdopterin-binding protein [Caulobacteraceae bacterium]|jgi:molybdenum cofactor synthesis domain-containing protein|nr:molybdopterin-binding protein [Caulobacteraceae bacterium]
MSATVDKRRVTAAALVIGDEILSGRTQDVNLSAIAKYLALHGVDLVEARVVADDRADIVAAVNALRSRYDYVVTTGGIGPTHDDITADCVAEAFGVALVEDPQIVAEMTVRYGGEEPNAARRRMARIPEGGSKVKNPVSGPPGFQIGNVFVLAGVPRVAQGMLEDIGWRLKGGAVVLSRTVRVVGVPEGMIAAPLEQVARAHPDLSLGSYPFYGPAGFGANLVVRGRDAAAVEAAVGVLVETLAAAGIAAVRQEEG